MVTTGSRVRWRAGAIVLWVMSVMGIPVVGLAQSKLMIPMDLSQTDHLKAYGIAYWVLTKNLTVDWLLNYRGGSFMIDNLDLVAKECRIRGVSS
ncbi:MAG TPA: hypothetical protein VKO87_13620, partial [Gemmatimonadaceae bacterium]|nr:hypothetical protein [Gemmatimonadaceae bacterium]